ncbi:hypothetical protein CEXT_731301 [Caerostris extrusa]|uniref:Uncharacterized protein n=1 Tax=Caerostris extrusa TaxID=172846 RepID=A0AAV4X614_CAEEX|nr:hypothetical protein CEXT_731301 [Caerostris extrusa]
MPPSKRARTVTDFINKTQWCSNESPPNLLPEIRTYVNSHEGFTPSLHPLPFNLSLGGRLTSKLLSSVVWTEHSIL